MQRNKHRIDFDVSKNKMCKLLDDYVYDDYHKKLLKERLIYRRTFETIAFDNNTSVTTVKRIIYSYDDKLKKWTKM